MRIDTIIAAVAARHGGLVPRHEAIEAGVPASCLDRRRRSGLLVPEQRGVYRLAGVTPGHSVRSRAAVLAAAPDGVLSHRSAARALGLPGGRGLTIDLTVPRARFPRVDGAVLHRSLDLQPGHVREVDGVPITTVERTLADLGDVVPPTVVERALAQAVTQRCTTVDRVAAILDEIGGRGRNGRGALRQVLAEWSCGPRPPDSVLEVRFARLLADAGLPLPVFQHEIWDEGRFVARVDAAWLAPRVVGEVDGFVAHASPAQLRHDRARQNRLVRLGFTVLRWTWDDVRAGVPVRDLRPLLVPGTESVS